MKRNTDAKEKSENKSKKAWRFYRSNLPSLIWSEDTNGVIANFSKGHFTTENKKLADMLRSKGYIEIDLDSTTPPNIIVNKPVHVLKDGQNIPIGGNPFTSGVIETIQAPEVIV